MGQSEDQGTSSLIEELRQMAPGSYPQGATPEDPDAIRFRICRLYMAVMEEVGREEKAETPFGAQRWFARVADFNDRTVRRWIQEEDRSEPKPSVFHFLNRAERKVGRRALNRAAGRLYRESRTSGETVGKVTPEIRSEIHELAEQKDGPSQRKIADHFNLSESTVSRVLSGER